MTVSFPPGVERERAVNRGFFSFLAALYQANLENIVADPGVVHDAFAAAIRILRENTSARELVANFHVSPITGRIDELDKQLIRAEQYGLIQFPNPSYTRIRIALSKRHAEDLLSAQDDLREVFENAAAEFKRVYLEKSW